MTSSSAKFNSTDPGDGITVATTRSITGSLTLSSTTLTSSQLVATDAGQAVSGAGIPAGTTITSVTPGTSATLSNAATANETNESVTVTGTLVTTIASVSSGTQVQLSASWPYAPSSTLSVTINGQKKIESALAHFNQADVGGIVSNNGSFTGIPGPVSVSSVTNLGTPTTVTTGTTSTSRSVTDGAITFGSTTLTSATANFNAATDNGATVSGNGIPSGTTITVTSSTTATMSNAATLTLTGDSVTITEPIGNFAHSGVAVGDAVVGAGVQVNTVVTAINSGPSPTVGTQLTLSKPVTTATQRTITDGSLTSGSNTLSSASANFTSGDIGASVTGAGIPAATVISSVTNATTAVLSANATLNESGDSITITNTVALSFLTAITSVTGNVATLSNQPTQTTTSGTVQIGGTNNLISTATFTAGEVGQLITGVGAYAAQTFSDGVTVAGSNQLTSATANFTSADVGDIVTDSTLGTDIPSGTVISSVTNATTVVLSKNATATVNAQSITLSVPNQGIPANDTVAYFYGANEIGLSAQPTVTQVAGTGWSIAGNVLTSTSAEFRPADIGALITNATYLNSGTYITGYISETEVTISQTAISDFSGQAVTINLEGDLGVLGTCAALMQTPGPACDAVIGAFYGSDGNTIGDGSVVNENLFDSNGLGGVTTIGPNAPSGGWSNYPAPAAGEPVNESLFGVAIGNIFNLNEWKTNGALGEAGDFTGPPGSAGVAIQNIWENNTGNDGNTCNPSATVPDVNTSTANC